jgi:hypothetical protein
MSSVFKRVAKWWQNMALPSRKTTLPDFGEKIIKNKLSMCIQVILNYAGPYISSYQMNIHRII